jgi:hypothetical protein
LKKEDSFAPFLLIKNKSLVVGWSLKAEIPYITFDPDEGKIFTV